MNDDSAGPDGAFPSMDHLANRTAARARALAASSARFRGGAVVVSAARSLSDTAAMSSTAASNAAWLTCDGLLKPLTLRTNCRDAARISCSVTGGWKLNRMRMFLHMTRRGARDPRMMHEHGRFQPVPS